jgi:nucleotide-binding universal stress UspA family protein
MNVQTIDLEAKPQAAVATWKTVLTHVEPHEACAARLQAAVDLTRRCDALLIGVAAETIEPLAISDAYGYGWDGTALTVLRDQVSADFERAKAMFLSHTNGVRAAWRAIDDRPAPALARAARSADVIVAGGPAIRQSNRSQTIDTAELVLLSGRPVLIAPAKPASLEAKRVVVAWKDGREARRATADALPLLAMAEEVLVVEVCGKGDVDDAAFRTSEVAENLQRHGIAARSTAVAASNDEVGDILIREADALGADLIVAGCYGRNRMSEWLFGGATLDLLETSGRFLLMSH